MRMNTFYKVLSSLTVLALLGACGGSTPAADEPEQSAKASDDSKSKGDEKKDDSASEEGDDKADKKADKKDDKADKKDKDKDEKEEEASSTEGPKFTRTAKDILLAPEVVFMFSFNDSDAKKEAEEKCEKSVKDPKKKNECVAKARKKFDNADGYRFEKDGETWVWHTVRKQGTKLVSIHKIVVEIEEKDKTVILKPTGRDKGTKPWGNPPRQVKFDVPNDYQITQDDPKQGKLVYEAKIGILGDGSKPAR
jgi:hypothetical protein